MLAHEAGELGSCESLLVHRKPANWLIDYLEFFEGGAVDLPQVTTDKYTVICDELVFVPGPSGDLLRFPLDVYARYGAYLRTGVANRLGAIEQGGDVVWISRSDAPERSCRNVLELQRIFSEVTGREQREVLLTGMPLDEQIRQLSSAAVIVAEEGQALNLLPFVTAKQVVLLDKGSKTAQSRWNQGFEKIAKAVGNEVHCLFSELDSSVLQWEYPSLKFRGEIGMLEVLKL
jgi:capsular polysaccharide biosynthesis protein